VKKALPQNVAQFEKNPYRKKRSIYHSKKGHTGRDLRYDVGDVLLSPITGTVVRILDQKQMGRCMYIKHHATGDIHVFAHNRAFLVKVGDDVSRLQEIIVTGNTGTATSAPHVHYEIITEEPINVEDKIMTRSLAGFVGYNTNPHKRLKELYELHNIDFETGKRKIILYPAWLNNIIKRIFYPISVPDSHRIKKVKQLKQGSSNACSVYACLHALLVIGKLGNLKGAEIHKAILLKRYDKYDPWRSVSTIEVLKYLKERGYIRKYRKIRNSLGNFRIKIFTGHPIIASIQATNMSHAVCINEYNEKEFIALDSNSYKKMAIKDFDTIKDSYILFV